MALIPKVEARFFVVLALSVIFYFIAGNTGSGWIYLLSSTMTAAVIMGLLSPIGLLVSLKVQIEAPQKFIAGERASILIRVAPGAMPIPVRWLRLSYRQQRAGRKMQSADARYLAIEVLGEEVALTWTTEPLRRGVRKLGKVTASTCFPMGLVWWQRQFDCGDKTITVYPTTVRIDGFFLYKLKPAKTVAGAPSRSHHSARQSTSTRGIREYVIGDSPRIVHWASTARTGRLLVREFEAEGMPQFDVLLDLNARWQTDEQFELAVIAAGSLLSLGHRLGIGPTLMLNPPLDTLALDLPSMPPGIELQMEILARVNPLRSAEPQASWAPERNGGNTLVVIRPEGEPDLPATDLHTIEVASDATGDGGRSITAPGRFARSQRISRSLIANEEDIMEL